MLSQDELVNDFDLGDLFKAYFDCRKNKRTTHSALEFELDLEKNLLLLYKELKNGTYEIGKCICFVVTRPKPREVWAANFRDRIVHHLVYNAIKNRFYKRFIKDTYSCIPERGTLAAANRLLHFTRSATQNYTKKMYYLKADLSNFFVSIDKDILFALLQKYVVEDWLLKLLKQIIYHDPRTNVYRKSPPYLYNLIPPYKSLWNSDNLHGLPIGNLTSQFFSNVYLNVLDQFVKRKLKCKYYVRYVDDFIIIYDNPKSLNRFFELINIHLQTHLKLKLHPCKKLINTVTQGINFVGFFLLPDRILLRKWTLNKIRHCILRWQSRFNPYGSRYLEEFFRSINSYLGMLVNLKSFNLRFYFASMVNSLFIFPDCSFSKCCVGRL